MAMHQQRMGQRIALWRERAGLSQEEAAAAAGLSLRGWQRAEYGEVTPYPRNLEKIASALGVAVEELRGDPPKSTDDVADQLDRIEAKLDRLLGAIQGQAPEATPEQPELQAALDELGPQPSEDQQHDEAGGRSRT